MKTISYIVVRIKNDVKVLFADEFINGNEVKTQNELIETLSLLLDEKDFDVHLRTKSFE